MVRTPDKMKKTEDLKDVKASIKKRTIRISEEASVNFVNIVLEKDHPYATIRIRRPDDDLNTLRSGASEMINRDTKLEER